jgi:hypothetical protein
VLALGVVKRLRDAGVLGDPGVARPARGREPSAAKFIAGDFDLGIHADSSAA